MIHKNVITYGTFDLFHVGHLNLFKKLKNLGDFLIVAVSTDEFNALKGKKSIIPYKQRAEIVQNIKFVDKVIPETCWEQKINDIKKYKIDIFGIGSDWKGKFDYLNSYCEIVYIDRTEGISSPQLKDLLQSINISKDKFIQAFELLEQIKSQLG